MDKNVHMPLHKRKKIFSWHNVISFPVILNVQDSLFKRYGVNFILVCPLSAVFIREIKIWRALYKRGSTVVTTWQGLQAVNMFGTPWPI